ncbi:hypothetical protein E3N88_19243 [Mikania micrantha]|uniref:Uncharacterized protein n=1 Tax=Mikania micrantha TaxID=192012 RepID=A0A5N6NQM6_9ASTR|nr:hypothetical protein E3N88_19243 [Mikania micrantha]
MRLSKCLDIIEGYSQIRISNAHLLFSQQKMHIHALARKASHGKGFVAAFRMHIGISSVPPNRCLAKGRKEAKMLMYDAIDDL